MAFSCINALSFLGSWPRRRKGGNLENFRSGPDAVPDVRIRVQLIASTFYMARGQIFLVRGGDSKEMEDSRK